MSYAFRDEPVAEHARRGAGQHAVADPARPVPRDLLRHRAGVLAAWRRGTAARCRVADLQPVHVVAADVLPGDPAAGLRRELPRICRRRAERPSARRTSRGGRSWPTSCATWRMPTLAFTLVLLGEYMLIMRSSVLEVFSEDYILTAKAKGLSTFRIIRDHALRNAMLPMVTLIAINLAFTVSGAIQVEAGVQLARARQPDRRGGRRARLPGAAGRLPADRRGGGDRQPGRRRWCTAGSTRG